MGEKFLGHIKAKSGSRAMGRYTYHMAYEARGTRESREFTGKEASLSFEKKGKRSDPTIGRRCKSLVKMGGGESSQRT